MQIFDYIIIGAGSAGCVLANQLSAKAQWPVCGIEAGGSDGSFRVPPQLNNRCLPGDHVQSDEGVHAYLRAEALTVFHPVGT